MRAFERQDGESTKAFDAFKVYRDLGHERTLAKTAEIYYGASKNLSQIGVWSRRFSWVERAQSWDDWHEMIRRDAVEDHLRAQAKDHGRREAALLERALGVREAAMDQAEKMLQWPLSKQRVVNEGEDGEQVVYEFAPAGWSKATAVQLFGMALGNATPEVVDDALLQDFRELSEEELQSLISISEKIGLRPEDRR